MVYIRFRNLTILPQTPAAYPKTWTFQGNIENLVGTPIRGIGKLTLIIVLGMAAMARLKISKRHPKEDDLLTLIMKPPSWFRKLPLHTLRQLMEPRYPQ